VALAGFLARAAKRTALIKQAVIAYLGSFADNNSASVVDKQTLSDFRARVNFNPGNKAAYLRNNTRGNYHISLIKPMRRTVHYNRVNARICQHYFKSAASRRVARLNRLYIFLYFIQKRQLQTPFFTH
jgi:hypothetical protein